MNKPTSYLKMRVLGAIDMAEGASIRARIKAASEMTFHDEEGRPRRFTWRTIETWYCRYHKHGATTLAPRERTDKGKTRKITPEALAEAVAAILPRLRKPTGGTHPHTPKRAALYRLCIEENLFAREQIAPNTFSRLVAKFGLLQPESQARERMAFSKAHANELWQADTLVGPYVQHRGAPVQSRLIAFLDDASRVCCHGQFFPAENVDTLIESLRAAFYKRGIPQAIYVDNGSIYTSKEIHQITARLGILLHHAPVRDGAAKGKIERFFRTVRDQFLCRQLDLCGFEALNRQFTAWVEEHYNARVHSSLQMSPLDRFGLDRHLLRFLPPNEVNDELFFVEETRQVRADNTFSFQSLRWESPRHLPNREAHIRFSRRDPKGRVILYYKGERMGEARPLDPVANDRKPSGQRPTPNP